MSNFTVQDILRDLHLADIGELEGRINIPLKELHELKECKSLLIKQKRYTMISAYSALFLLCNTSLLIITNAALLSRHTINHASVLVAKEHFKAFIAYNKSGDMPLNSDAQEKLFNNYPQEVRDAAADLYFKESKEESK